MPWKTMISEYKALSLADKAGFWGSIASVVGLVLTIFGTHSIIPFAFGPLGFLLALAISGLIGFYAHWLSRAGFVRQALPQIPKHERGRVIRQHLGSTLPAELSPSEWLRDRRMLFRFWIYTGLILTVLLIATMLIWAFVDAPARLEPRP